MMQSSSQVFDYQLIFHIMYGLGQFHHRQNEGEERRGEGRFGKKNQLLSKHRATADGKNSQKIEERGAFDEHHPHLMKRHVE